MTGTVRVIVPKLALLTAIRLSPGVVPGMSKFTWLKTLKNSARNCTFIDPLNRKFLNSPMFQLWNEGPRRKPFGTSPNVPTSATAKAAGLNHSVSARTGWRRERLTGELGAVGCCRQALAAIGPIR